MAASLHVIAPRSEITPLALAILRKAWEKPRTIPQLFWDASGNDKFWDFTDYLNLLALLFREELIEGAVEPRPTQKGIELLFSAVVAGRPEVEGMMRIAEVPEPIDPCKHSVPALEEISKQSVFNKQLEASALESRIESVISRLDHSVNKAMAATKFCECGAQANFLCDCEKPICKNHSYDTYGAQCDFGICGECQEAAEKHFNNVGGKNL